MSFLDSYSEGPSPVPPRQHELAIQILSFLSPVLSLVVIVAGLTGKYPWISKPWVLSVLIMLSTLFLLWIAKPRLAVLFSRFQQGRRARQFISTSGGRLRELVDQFAVFASNSDNRSLVTIIRSAYAQNQGAVEQLIVADHIRVWLQCYQHQISFPVTSLDQFMSQSQEFSSLVTDFNDNYALHAQKRLVAAPPMTEDFIAKLEEFREEYAAFLRDVEFWAKGFTTYLGSLGMTDHSTQWRLAPLKSFVRPQSFRITKPVKE